MVNKQVFGGFNSSFAFIELPLNPKGYTKHFLLAFHDGKKTVEMEFCGCDLKEWLAWLNKAYAVFKKWEDEKSTDKINLTLEMREIPEFVTSDSDKQEALKSYG